MNIDHIVFNRPQKHAMYFSGAGIPNFGFDASGDAWGNAGSSGAQPPYGHACWLAPGHYVLGQIDTDSRFPNPSEGPGQIWVGDLTDEAKTQLIASGHCIAHPDTGMLDIGGILLPRGGIAQYGRAEIMIHAGGSNLGEHALDDRQPLLKTFGCTRVHNADLRVLMTRVASAHQEGRIVVFSCIGDPAIVSN